MSVCFIFFYLNILQCLYDEIFWNESIMDQDPIKVLQIYNIWINVSTAASHSVSQLQERSFSDDCFHLRQGPDMSGDSEKVFHRSLDLLHFWITDCRQVDFTAKSGLVETLENFLNTEVPAAGAWSLEAWRFYSGWSYHQAERSRRLQVVSVLPGDPGGQSGRGAARCPAQLTSALQPEPGQPDQPGGGRRAALSTLLHRGSGPEGEQGLEARRPGLLSSDQVLLNWRTVDLFLPLCRVFWRKQL